MTPSLITGCPFLCYKGGKDTDQGCNYVSRIKKQRDDARNPYKIRANRHETQ